MTSWWETPIGRFTAHITNIFDEYIAKNPQYGHEKNNSLLEIRNLIIESVRAFLGEPSIRKKYGVPIDALSLVSFSSNDEPFNPKSSWIPIQDNEKESRPAGITNEEFSEICERLDRVFIAQGMHSSGLSIKVLELFREAFLKPEENRPFNKGTYTRLIFGKTVDSETTKKQTIPCEVCGENRTIDSCHIIPKRLNGTQDIDNIIFLCPTHHRLFDSCMLSKEEWGKIDWTRKSHKAQIYAEKVLKTAQLRFWDKIEARKYEKQTTWEIGLFDLYEENEKEIEK